MDGLSQDWRNGWRLLRSSPTTTAVILGVMMLATGATTASFSVVDAVVLRGLPFYQSDRLVSLDRMGSGKAVISSFAALDYLAIRAQQDVFEGLAGTLVLRRAEGDDSEVIRSQRDGPSLAPEVRIVSDRRIEADRKRYGGQVNGWSPGGRGATCSPEWRCVQNAAAGYRYRRGRTAVNEHGFMSARAPTTAVRPCAAIGSPSASKR